MILQINKFYSPDIGGVETVVKDYAEFLNKYDDVVVLCVNKKFSLKTKIVHINDIKVYRCASLGTFFSMPISLVFFIYLFFLSRKADYIHSHEPFPLGSIGGLIIPAAKKIFVTWHSDIIKQRSIKKLFEIFQRKLCKKANKIISTSDNLVKFSSILSFYNNKVTTIPLAINPESYEDINIENIKIQLMDKEYVLFLGRFAYYKGIFVLLDAIEMIQKSIPFVIVGDGELSSDVRLRVDKSKKNITLIDRFVNEDEKKYLLKNSKFMVFPSIYPSEAFGILQLEAMVYGKPVINTYLPTGVPWVSVHNKSGLTVQPSDAEDLAKNIRMLYENTELYKELCIGARERVLGNFTSEKVNKKLYELYF